MRFVLLCRHHLLASGSRDTLRRISLLASPAQMEFRIFFPVLSAEDTQWLPEASVRRYNEALGRLDLPSAMGTEERSDQYIVGPAFMGLKYRHGDRLELKVRDSAVNGIERWTKAKLGRDHPRKYLQEISTMLSRFGHSIDVTCLDLDAHLELKKTRRNASVDMSLDYEACHLELHPDSVVRVATKGSSRRLWFTLAVEGYRAPDIETFLSSSRSQPLRAALSCANEVLLTAKPEAAARRCIPVVSGYPLFVRYLSGVATDEEVERDVVGGWDALVERLKL
jgi:hypothetical protein